MTPEFELPADSEAPDDAEDRPVFYYDLGSPYAYLTAERIHAVFDPPYPVWQPILLGGLFAVNGRSSWMYTDARAEGIAEVERRAGAYGLQPVRWPDPSPAESTVTAMRAAVFAKQIGKGVAYSLAAFRQAFAAGSDLSQTEAVLIAAAACEIHPRALLAALQRQSLKDELRSATEQAAADGVFGVPSVRVGDQVFWGDDQLERAAAAAR